MLFNFLDYNILDILLPYLTVQSLLNLRATSKRFTQLCTDHLCKKRRWAIEITEKKYLMYELYNYSGFRFNSVEFVKCSVHYWATEHLYLLNGVKNIHYKTCTFDANTNMVEPRFDITCVETLVVTFKKMINVSLKGSFFPFKRYPIAYPNLRSIAIDFIELNCYSEPPNTMIR